MRLAWFTPFSHRSAIGRFSEGVVRELSKAADVELYCFDSGGCRTAPVPVHQLRTAADVPDRDIARWDIAIYNFGNYLPYHREIYAMSRRRPGICILHDFVMRDFFAAYYGEHLGGEDLDNLLGSDEHPMFEEAARGALGVVTHSNFFRRRVETAYPGPVRGLSLPYQIDRTAPVLTREVLDVPADRLLLLTVGDVNPNKQVPRAIDALARLGPFQQRILYVVAGECSGPYRRTLEAAARRGQLSDEVRFAGYVPDEVLRSYLAHADICINLRQPPTEGASASAIEEMLFAKPVIANNVGFFSELPDDTVVKIDLAREGDLESALRNLVQDKDARVAIGRRACQYAKAEFRADRYAAEFLDFAWEVRGAQPLLGLSDQVGRECNRMGVTRDMALVVSLAREMERAFCQYLSDLPLWRE